MRFVLMGKLKPGMQMAADLFDMSGRVIVGKGGILTENYIKRLKELGFGGVYIRDDKFDDVEITPAIPDALRKEGMTCLKDEDIDRCKEIAKAIVLEILPKGKVSLDLADLRSYDDYTYAHSVNVAVLCCALGMGIGLDEKELENLVLAGLLHDIGKRKIPPEILNKNGRLTAEEYQVIKTHPTLSYEMLADNYEISAHVKKTVLFHHENVDGSGYPNGITGAEQTTLIKIIHIADVYDALTSKRPYKDPYSPFEAAEYLMGACGIMFDREMVTKFLQLVPLYPRGTEVYLSDGHHYIVVENAMEHNLRPIVRRISDGVELDLAEREHMNLAIVYEDGQFVSMQNQNEESRREMLKEVKKHRIMVVDDMATNLQMIRELLSLEYDLVLLKSGNQALLYMKKNEYPDLILMDIDMPEMNGVETARQINEMTGGKVPILFVSAICDKETVLMCKEQNAVGYIARPYKEIYMKSEISCILG